MTELTAETFNEICRSGPVHEALASSEASQAALQRKGRNRGFAALGATLVLAVLGALASPAIALFVVCFGLVGTFWVWRSGRAKAAADMKTSVLPHIAERAGLVYDAEPSDPEGFQSVQATLFRDVNRLSFSDRFRGQIDGRDMAFYEAKLDNEVGAGSDSDVTNIFQGQIYWMPRRSPARGVTVVVPDGKLRNIFKPKGMERVKFDSDREFENRFEVYSTAPAEAETALGSPELRARLLELREGSPLFLQLGETEIVIAVPGSNRYEPGDMGKKISGQDRARRMFDDVCASLTLAKELSRRFE